jgi:hypothetical protein
MRVECSSRDEGYENLQEKNVGEKSAAQIDLFTGNLSIAITIPIANPIISASSSAIPASISGTSSDAASSTGAGAIRCPNTTARANFIPATRAAAIPGPNAKSNAVGENDCKYRA